MTRRTRFVGSPGPRCQGPGPDLRLRKASDQPSGHSQVTESSGSTPESCPELLEEDEDGDFVPGGNACVSQLCLHTCSEPPAPRQGSKFGVKQQYKHSKQLPVPSPSLEFGGRWVVGGGLVE
ncbi:oxysterol-binding protein-related protein 5-like [Rhinolophus ferrumequinum]|uniref:oxysterol-binding protein-related protein 5-like n=1 Tax=Rhinolophus ferrumequinum TaxID=59479 RepID=UPI00140FFAC0|nr:oxysterol-binding protein-related protein 5-like [Rhinolophus ferrumequinum]XP_032976874.1 oxysterol-binding protein-related protein 5-like [Rhinolophus ferrumequinum]